ncbi:MAG: 5'-methylthioadenosine/adenosylhomocysteine nucleosidase [Sedimentisphaerales bacterium]|nr:5'-methylthioadenosine/adenosylhomocysteine nucleosidase [Sedimentisphaerales bacterium]
MNRHLLAAVCLTVAALLTSCRSSPMRGEVPGNRLAVLGAFRPEVELLEKTLTDARVQEVEGIAFMSGRLGGTPLVVAWTGVGKVNAAMTTTLLIEHFHPTRVIVTGIAGAIDPNLEPGDIVIARRTAHHDMGTLWPEGMEHGGVKNRLTGEDNPVFFPGDPSLLAAADCAARRVAFDPIDLQSGRRPPRIVTGTIVTGDAFVASKEKCRELQEKLRADAVEMEGAAVAQVCYQRRIGCLVIRSMSDKADESAVIDKQLFYDMAARNSATLVAGIIQCLGSWGDRRESLR